SAHAFDEQHNEPVADTEMSSSLPQVSQLEGVEFVLAMKPGEAGHQAARGLENPERMAQWSRQTMERFRELGDRLHAGPVEQVEGLGPQRTVVLARHGYTDLCIGWKPSMTPDQVREMTRKVLSLWVS